MASIDPDGYVRLRIRLVGANGQPASSVKMDHCPSASIWDLDVKNLLKGDKTVSLGVTVNTPGLPDVVLNPMILERKSAGFLGTGQQCTLTIDQIDYSSPLVAVARSSGQFVVKGAIATTSAPSPNLIADLDRFLSVATSFAGVPTIVASKFTEVGHPLLQGSALTNSDTYVFHANVAAGAPPGPFTWVFADAIPHKKPQPSENVNIVASIEPVASLLSPKPDGGWTPDAVLNSRFKPGTDQSTNPAGTIEGYLSATAQAAVDAYGKATVGAADATCKALRLEIVKLELSNHDQAMVLWAMAHRRNGFIAGNGTTVGGVPSAVAVTSADIDAMSCLSADWGVLKAEGITKVIDDLPLRGVAPTTQQMTATVDSNTDLARFFVRSAWADREPRAERLFGYPLVFNDPKKAMMLNASNLAGASDWLAHAYVIGEVPSLSMIGCYAYFPWTSNGSNLATKAGDRSMMMAIADVPQSSSPFSGKSVALKLYFASVPQGQASNPKIAQIDVLTELSAEERTAMQTAIGSKTECDSGYKPDMLFGH